MKNKSTFAILLEKMFRDLKNGWKQFLAIIFISTLAVTLFVGLSSNALTLENQVNVLYRDGNMADLWIYVSQQNNDDLLAIENIIGEESQYETRFVYESKLNGGDATAVIVKNYPTINKPANISSERESHFFIVDQNFASALAGEEHPKEGDEMIVSIPLYTLSSTLNINESTLQVLDNWAKGNSEEERKENNIFRHGTIDFTFIVTGVMIHPENVQNSSFSSSMFILDYDYFFDSLTEMIRSHFRVEQIEEYISFEDLINLISDSPLNEINIYNQICIKLDSKHKVKQVKEAIEEYYSDKNNLLYVTTASTLPSNAVIQNDITQARQLTYIFPMVFFVVAILVTLTTLSQIIIKERTQIGTLKALGVSKSTIFFHYLVLSFFVISIGIIVGAVVGPLLLPNVLAIKYTLLYTLPPKQIIFPFLEFFASTIVFLTSITLVCLFVTHNELKRNPVESMRPASLKTLKAKKRNGSTKYFASKMAFRNIRRDKVKSFMVILGVLGCTALLVCGFGIDDTINHGINVDVTSFYDSDLLLTYQGGASPQIETIQNIAYKNGTLNDVIVDIDEYTELPSTIKFQDKSLSYTAIGLNPNNPFVLFPISENNLSLSLKVARELGVKEGDEISFTIMGTTYSGNVEYIFEAFSVHSVFYNKTLDKYSSLNNISSGGWINIDQKKADFNEVKEALKADTAITVASTSQENRERINSVVSSISYMTMAIKTFAILLAIVVLYNLVLLNYREKTRDIATLKVLGFSKMEIAKSLILEVMFLTTIGIIFGILLGQPMQILVLMVNQTPIVDFLYTTTTLSYILSFFITFGTSIITNLLLSNLTGRIKMVESLKSVE